MTILWLLLGGLALALVAGVLHARNDARKYSREAPPQKPHLLPTIRGPGNFAVEVVGESFHGAAFKSLLGPSARTDPDGDTLTHAQLHLDDHNPHDANAVRVEILGLAVGHLSRVDARDFRQAVERDGLGQYRVFQVAARVYHGGSEELFSVSVDLPLA